MTNLYFWTIFWSRKGIGAMEVALSEAKAKLTDLVRRAEAGDEIILTRHGRRAVRLVPVVPKPSNAEREALLEALHGAGEHDFGPDAARATDWLYDDDGLPA
ncbi:MAG: type II toxin-antitoxin system Phd/YefM family antitoxin [Allosphingosinicella sp.]